MFLEGTDNVKMDVALVHDYYAFVNKVLFDDLLTYEKSGKKITYILSTDIQKGYYWFVVSLHFA